MNGHLKTIDLFTFIHSVSKGLSKNLDASRTDLLNGIRVLSRVVYLSEPTANFVRRDYLPNKPWVIVWVICNYLIF